MKNKPHDAPAETPKTVKELCEKAWKNSHPSEPAETPTDSRALTFDEWKTANAPKLRALSMSEEHACLLGELLASCWQGARASARPEGPRTEEKHD